MVDQLSSFAAEVTRVGREVGTDGELGGQAVVPGVAGIWKDLTDNVNLMASNLTVQLRDVSKVATAIASGDLTQKVTVDVRGEILQIKNVINTMVDQLRSFAAEVTRVAREVGTEGKLGGQAVVPGVSGTWKDLTDNVNFMAGNLTSQVRGIADVVTAVANGDLTRKLTVEAEGEIAALSDTINGMIETLATFADQVTTVAREVGVEGKLGGQASVPGAAGTWKDLTDNVNRLAANLTTQVRAIAEVATAVTKGDLTRSIQVEAQARGRGAQGQHQRHDPQPQGHDRQERRAGLAEDQPRQVLAHAAGPARPAHRRPDGALGARVGRLGAAGRALRPRRRRATAPACGCWRATRIRRTTRSASASTWAKASSDSAPMDRRKLELRTVPSDYLKISSGLGEATPVNLVVLPILFEGQVKGVLELASFDRFNPMHHAFLDQLTESIGIVLHTIEANTRTEDLLKQSQSLARELQLQQQELQRTNQQLEEKAELLAEQNVEVERKNTEVEQARQALEEKAKQLALTSKFKSEFLANMSHELQHAAQQPADPVRPALDATRAATCRPSRCSSRRRFMRRATTCSRSSTTSSTCRRSNRAPSSWTWRTTSLDHLRTYVERTFRHVAEAQRLEFTIDIDPKLPRAIRDRSEAPAAGAEEPALERLQVHRTRIREARHPPGSRAAGAPNHDALSRARSVMAISVVDTGIGISAGEAADHLRGVPAGRRQHEPQVRRHRPGPGHQPRACASAWRRADPGQQPRPRQHVHALLPQTASRARGRSVVIGPTESAVPPSVVLPVGQTPVAVRCGLPCSTPPTIGMPSSPATGCCSSWTTIWRFAGVLMDLARERSYKAMIDRVRRRSLALARERQPDAITLDICLPDIDGWHVLDRLKHDLATRHIPVFVITTEENTRARLCSSAPSACSTSPCTRATPWTSCSTRSQSGPLVSSRR